MTAKLNGQSIHSLVTLNEKINTVIMVGSERQDLAMGLITRTDCKGINRH